ncbi:MAG TPA: NlpC/P60 family protein [Bacillota bacterium]|nr:NlpC/P60 family protein [Bacillota bacterium]
MKKRIVSMVLATFFLSSTAFADQQYTVAPGDSLDKIADQFGVSPKAIQDKNNLSGWVIDPDQKLVIPSGDNSDTANKVAFVNADDLNFRDNSDLNATVIKILDRGTTLEVLEYGDKWTKVKNGDSVGYVSTRYLSFNQGKASRGSAMMLNRVRDVALSLEGAPYRSGGTTPDGFDCSGFTRYVMDQVGVTLPRSSSDQYQAGTSVGRDELQVGDLLFFDSAHSGKITHVGMYIGNNKMIHSATRDVEVSDLDWYFDHYKYFGAKRVLGS